MARAPTYKGIAFPFKKGTQSFPETSTDNDLVKQSIIQIVLTGLGERVMRPEFGSKVYAFIFENNDLVLQETIKAEVMSAVGRFEPRAIVRDVGVSRDDSILEITVSYVVIATRQEQTAVIGIPIEGNV